MQNKASSLKSKIRHIDSDSEFGLDPGAPSGSAKPAETKIILRKSEVPAANSGKYALLTSFAHKSDCCVYYPKVPRAWMPEGLVVIPCLSEKGVRGQFDLDVFCSEPVKLTVLPDAFSRAMAGEWNEATAGGSHICHATWKKNAKYSLKLRGKSIASTKVTITLTRTDAVGCMLGYVIFIHRINPATPTAIGELTVFYESPYVPANEVSTDLEFTLPPLEPDEEFCVMPTTFAEGKIGAFVLSIIAECEFTLALMKQ